MATLTNRFLEINDAPLRPATGDRAGQTSVPKPKPVRTTASVPRKVSLASAVPQSPAVPAAPVAPVAAAIQPGVLDLDEIRAALSAISGMFNLQRGQLTAEQESAMSAFDFLKRSFGEAQEEAVTATRSQAAGQGILRSGLYLQNVGQIAEAGASQLAQASAEKDARVRAIAAQIAGVSSQEQAERALKARTLAREQVGTQAAIAEALKLV